VGSRNPSTCCPSFCFKRDGKQGCKPMQTYPTGYTESHRIAEQIFREILPRHGMAVREEQIALCHEVLDTLYNKEISLCEAGVGTGKTLAYLVGCILWQMNRPDRLKLPVVISTSSVALQDAIINDYLPNLSAILLEERIIQVPLTAVIRKGKERFVCDARLIERESQIPATRKRQRNSLHMAERTLDMDHIPELSRFDRNRICVPQSCPRDCVWHESCRFQQYLRDSMKPDIQISTTIICWQMQRTASRTDRYYCAVIRRWSWTRRTSCRTRPARCTRNPCQNAKCRNSARCYGRRTILTLRRACARRSGHWFLPVSIAGLGKTELSAILLRQLRFTARRWPIALRSYNLQAAGQICRGTCGTGWERRKARCVFFSWRFRRGFSISKPIFMAA